MRIYKSQIHLSSRASIWKCCLYTIIGNDEKIPTMHFFGISRVIQSKSYLCYHCLSVSGISKIMYCVGYSLTRLITKAVRSDAQNKKYPTQFRNIKFWLCISGNSSHEFHGGNVISMPCLSDNLVTYCFCCSYCLILSLAESATSSKQNHSVHLLGENWLSILRCASLSDIALSAAEIRVKIILDIMKYNIMKY